MQSIRTPAVGGSSGINNAIRGLASIVKRAVGSQGSAISSAGTTPIGAASTALYATVTGTTTITSFGSVGAGTLRIVEFTGTLTLTHNATSLKLPGSVNILTAAGDVGFFVSLGSGNWKCLHYSKADGSAVAGFNGTLTSTDAGAGNGPIFEAYRNSASPAANDEIGEINFSGNSSTAVKRQYGGIDCIISDPTNGSEDAIVRLLTIVGGTLTAPLSAAQGVAVGGPAVDKGVGTLNAAAGLYVAGHGTVAQMVRDTEATYLTAGTIIPFDDTIPQQTEGDEILSVAITPTNASSTLLILAEVQVSETGVANLDWAVAIFVDATANAIAARGGAIATSNVLTTANVSHSVVASSTTARTYKVRVGSSAATDIKVNGNGTARLMGGMQISSLTVIEILPQ